METWKRRAKPASVAGRFTLSDEARARLLAALLWLVVLSAAVGGIGSMVTRHRVPVAEPRAASGAVAPDVVAASGFAERFVAAYLAAGQGEEDGLVPFLGYAPELPASGAGAVRPAGAVRATGVEQVGEGYWAVTVAAGEAGGETFWRAAVIGGSGRFVAAGLPSPVAPPPSGEEGTLAVTLSVPPADDPLVETVTGWVTAHVCGRGDASRYLAPGVAGAAVTPPVCRDARLERWGASRPDGRGRVTVVTEVTLSGGPAERRVSFALVLARRGGRWEIAELLAAPPLRPPDAGGGPGSGTGEGGEVAGR